MEAKQIYSYSALETSQEDPLLAQVEFDMGEMLLPIFIQALAFQSGLEDSAIIFQMMYYIPKVVDDLEALKTGSPQDMAAYNSQSCQNILNFFTTPQQPGLESLYEAASKSDNNETANIIYCMEYTGDFNTKSGLLGQIRLFLSQYC